MTAHDPANQDKAIPSEISHMVEVPLPPERAFELFTGNISRWWPTKSHSVSSQDGTIPLDVEVQPREGGLIRETLPSGETAPWARIEAWEPGRRLRLAWYPGRGQAHATDVEITFAPIGNGTRVTVVHTGFDRPGAGGTASAASYSSGWAHVLGECFARHCAKPPYASPPVAAQ